MSSWDSPWGPAEKYAYRQGIKKGRVEQEKDDIAELRTNGFGRAAEFLATGEVPYPTRRIRGLDLPVGVWDARIVKSKTKKGKRGTTVLTIEMERADDCNC
jgi:hypothetical protein